MSDTKQPDKGPVAIPAPARDRYTCKCGGQFEPVTDFLAIIDVSDTLYQCQSCKNVRVLR
jgi:hypothetical protein